LKRVREAVITGRVMGEAVKENAAIRLTLAKQQFTLGETLKVSGTIEPRVTGSVDIYV